MIIECSTLEAATTLYSLCKDGNIMIDGRYVLQPSYLRKPAINISKEYSDIAGVGLTPLLFKSKSFLSLLNSFVHECGDYKQYNNVCDNCIYQLDIFFYKLAVNYSSSSTICCETID